MWMGISTNGIGKISVPVAPSTSQGTSKTESSSFADVMELSNKSKASTDVTSATPKQSLDNQSSTDMADTSGKISESSKSVEEANKYDQQNKIDDSKSTDAMKELSSDDATDNMKDVIKKVIDKIYDVLEEKLGCTEKDIEDVLENMGMLLQDLLVPNNLRDFVLQMNNATEIDFLISEQLPNLVSDIQNAIVDILETFGVTAEDVTNFLEDLISSDEATTADDLEVADQTKASNTQARVANNNDEALTNFEQKVDIISEANESSCSETNADTVRDQSSVAVNLNQAIEQAISPEQVEGINDFQGDVAQADIIRQVVEAVRVNLSSDHTSMTLQLNPENLGRVQISVIQKNGIMQAQIIAENEAAKNAIEGNLALLQESLDHQELKVESVEVMIASYEFFNQQEQQSNEQNSNQTRRQSNIGGFEGLDEVLEDEVLEDEMMRAQGNSVNYSI